MKNKTIDEIQKLLDKLQGDEKIKHKILNKVKKIIKDSDFDIESICNGCVYLENTPTL